MTASGDNPSPTPSDLAELKRLIAIRSDGVLGPSERDRLEQILAGSREARSMYIGYMQLNSGLDWMMGGRDSLRGLLDLTDEEAYAHDSAERVFQSTALRKHRIRLIYSIAAIAASLLLAVGWIVAWLAGDGRLAGEHVASVDQPLVRDEAAASSADAPHPFVANVAALSEESRWFVENRSSTNTAVHAGDMVRVLRGGMRLNFASGATVTMKAPAALEVISPMRTRVVLGTLTAYVPDGAQGFAVETPRTTVVDLGTSFGVNVNAYGSTDIVVFHGAVDLHSEGVKGLHAQQRFGAGEAVRVSGEGTASRIISIVEGDFSVADGAAPPRRTPIISAVNDNIDRGESWCYYEIVHGDMREDAKAFVDREHEWNGVDASGIPSFLLGSDYVKTFNDDKVNSKVEIHVTLERPAILYILLDERSPVPDWLRERFFNTGYEIGLDGSGYSRFGEYKTRGVGPGRSIDDVFSVWRLDVPHAGTVKLGALDEGGAAYNMYGIVALPMATRDGAEDSPFVSTDRLLSQAVPIDIDPNLSIDGAIGQTADANVFRFDWKGGVLNAACETRGFTSLDPVLQVYDSNKMLVGYARAQRDHRDHAVVTMNLPPGSYYAVVTGDDEVGEVGDYHLQMRSATGEVAPPLAPSPSLALKASWSDLGVALWWNKLPTPNSPPGPAGPGLPVYTIERSSDAVNFDPVTSGPTTSVVDETAKPTETYIYRLRASDASGPQVSAPLLVKASTASIERLNALGESHRVTLEWGEVLGERTYRIERSSDGKHFETIGTAPLNANGFRDVTVEPGRQYYYRVATENAQGKGLLSDPVVALTGAANVDAVAVADDRVELSWEADYSDVRWYIQRATAASGNKFVIIGEVDGTERLFVDRSAAGDSECHYRVVAAKDVSDLAETVPKGIDRIRLPEELNDEHSFALRFAGKIRVDRPGRYTFFLNSDDGSRLLVDGSLVVDNDGRHAERVVSSSVELVAGLHDLDVQYFEIDGKKRLELAWSGPGEPYLSINYEYARVPQSVLSSLTYRYYQGAWTRLPFRQTTSVSEAVAVKGSQSLENPGA